MICTWKDCEAEAVRDCLDRNGNPWASLCQEHFQIHEDAVNNAVLSEDKEVTGRDIKRMLGSWVKAHGGAKTMMEKIL